MPTSNGRGSSARDFLSCFFIFLILDETLTRLTSICPPVVSSSLRRIMFFHLESGAFYAYPNVPFSSVEAFLPGLGKLEKQANLAESSANNRIWSIVFGQFSVEKSIGLILRHFLPLYAKDKSAGHSSSPVAVARHSRVRKPVHFSNPSGYSN